MCAEARMKHLFDLFSLRFYYAGTIFKYRGILVWNGNEHIRIIAFNRFNDWLAKEDNQAN